MMLWLFFKVITIIKIIIINSLAKKLGQHHYHRNRHHHPDQEPDGKVEPGQHLAVHLAGHHDLTAGNKGISTLCSPPGSGVR